MRQTHQKCITKEKFKSGRTQEWVQDRLEKTLARLDIVLDKNRELTSENKDLKAEIRNFKSESKKKDRQLAAVQKKNHRLEKTAESLRKKDKSSGEKIEKLRDKCKMLGRTVSDLKMQHGVELKQLHMAYADLMNPDENPISDEVLSIQEENKRLKKEKAKLEKRDSFNDGPHTPSSKKTFTQKSSDAKKTKKNGKKKTKSARKPGGQPGHKGHAHKYGKPDETRHFTMNRCNKKNCRCKDLKNTRTENVYVEETTKPQKKTIKCIVEYYTCLKCGEKDMIKDDPLIRNGRYGPNIILQVLLNYLSRMPNRMNVEQLAIMAGIAMASSTAGGILKRIGSRLMAPANVLAQFMQRARILHVDETSISLNGKLVWVWTFFEPRSGKVLFVIRNSRGQKVPEENTGKGLARQACGRRLVGIC